MGVLSLLLTAFYIYTHIHINSATSPTKKDYLTPLQLLRDGDTLVSSNKTFELGFFSPGSRTDLKYLGLWYKNVIPLTVVWVANRNKPLKNLNATLEFSLDGSLVLKNGPYKNVSIFVPVIKKVHSPVLKLLDSGNLVVADGTINVSNIGGYIWQSFDYPSDTLLPGMKLGWDVEGNQNWAITSWKNNDDPSVGEFTFNLTKSQSPELVLVKNLTKQSRWGPWDGARFSGSSGFMPNPVFKSIFNFSNLDHAYFSFVLLDKSILVRLVVNQLGNILFLTWKNSSREWISVVTLNKDSCDHYESCGPNGACYIDEPTCRCLEGFIASSPSDWSRMDWMGGCKRVYNLNCTGGGDGFVKYKGLKLPDNSTVWPKMMSLEECRDQCLSDCTCIAYTYLNVHGYGSECVVWFGNLTDIRSYPQGGDELFVRMARKELESMAFAKKEKEATRIVVSVLLLIFLLVLLFASSQCICQINSFKTKAQQIANPSRESNRESHEGEMELNLIDMEIIAAATNNFSTANVIGKGGFGPVYKGELPNGQQIAVKRQCGTSTQGLEQFRNEFCLMVKLQHRNLVKLLGCCIHREERMLIYEYLPNKSLDKFIFDALRKKLLPWKNRFEIVIGIAKGLIYLHDDSRCRIIHRDLKAANILLDSEMRPKIADFGLAKMFGDEQLETTMRVVGTFGYISPEYGNGGHFSTKSDVYSFGVLVLEIIAGEKNFGFYRTEEDFNLLGYVWKLWNEKKALGIMDPVLEESFLESEVLRCIHVGLLCVQKNSEDRPTMSMVLAMLQNEAIRRPRPNEPGHCMGRASKEVGSAHDTLNGVTITTLTGR